MINIAVLTSSRADYGIYRPLLFKIQADDDIDMSILVFGTHLSPYHGNTINQIIADGFEVTQKIESLVIGDTPAAIASSMGLTLLKFADVWEKAEQNIDLILCLGDRYEMFSAVSASIPFNIPVAHIHGGETTLGAIDNKFRHALTHMAKYHFVSTELYADRVKQLINDDRYIYNVGALSLDNIQDVKLLSVSEFKERYDIDLNKPSILLTFHPETVDNHHSLESIRTVISVLEVVTQYQVIITLPNADTHNDIIRRELLDFIQNNRNRSHLIETFGTRGYFSCMKHCSFLMGNTSSGIIEAASFGKYVIDIGDRQKGRIANDNIFHVPINHENILFAVEQVQRLGGYKKGNLYWNGGAADKIISVLKSLKKKENYEDNLLC
ncbi:MAG TPA: UDP-N-acetylglucosamine 2-epimerase [Balneolales bacterium]|nr:UDP-N-acetylglucosamine 2-epimerase [Balneolales bacterium]